MPSPAPTEKKTKFVPLKIEENGDVSTHQQRGPVSLKLAMQSGQVDATSFLLSMKQRKKAIQPQLQTDYAKDDYSSHLVSNFAAKQNIDLFWGKIWRKLIGKLSND